MRSRVHKNETQSDRDRQDKIPGGISRNKPEQVAGCLLVSKNSIIYAS